MAESVASTEGPVDPLELVRATPSSGSDHRLSDLDAARAAARRDDRYRRRGWPIERW